MTPVFLALGAAACAVGPEFRPPAEPVPAQFSDATDRTSTASQSEDAWWRDFNDAELDRLEERTRDGNLDLQAMLLRIVESRTQVQVARAQGLPSLNATASFNREQLGLAGILKANGSTLGGTALNPGLVSTLTEPVSLYQLGFDASWELDLFGKVARTVEAANAQSAETEESRHDLLVSLEAEVAQDYLQLRAAQGLEEITHGLISREREVLDLTRNRQANGLAQQQDVESAQAQLASLESQLPPYEQNVATSRHALAVLMGRTPQALDEELAAPAPLPSLPARISIGVPSTLARRRPDIRQAEAALHAATAEVGVSMAALYPDITLKGTFGLRNTSSGYLFNWASKFYTAGPNVSLPLFNGGELVGNVKIARAEAAAAALNYRKTVLSALGEVEDGLVSLDRDAARVTALRSAVDADQSAFDITTHAYENGLSTYINVLETGIQANQARQQLAEASLTAATDAVKLYKALGGGWQDPNR